ncbi:MAG: hypothetical protein QOJ56_3143 [Mycobacterium sp.]|nr:hypothetical protein [Mycobacterium sp.]
MDADVEKLHNEITSSAARWRGGPQLPAGRKFLQCASVASGCAAGLQGLVTTEYRVWVRQTHRQLAAETGASEFEVLADALIML